MGMIPCDILLPDRIIKRKTGLAPAQDRVIANEFSQRLSVDEDFTGCASDKDTAGQTG